MNPSITYIKQLCVNYLKLPDDDKRKPIIIELIKAEAKTL